MDYNTYPCVSELAVFVKCFWTLEVPAEFSSGRQQVLPDGCMELIFNLGDDVNRVMPDDTTLTQPRAFILGQITKPMWIAPTGRVETFAVRFYPGSFSYFTSLPMTKLADQDTKLEKVFDPSKVESLSSAIKNAPDTQARISILESFLLSVLKDSVDSTDLVRSTVDKILNAGGSIGIKEMMESYERSRRQLERRYSKDVGLSPKQLCRIIRLQEALRAMLDRNKNLTDVGYDSHYYDQAHFIKDFKDFTGVSPREFYNDDDFILSSLLYGKD